MSAVLELVALVVFASVPCAIDFVYNKDGQSRMQDWLGD